MLPKQIDPIQLADNQKTLKGEIQLTEMSRLMELICDDHPGVASIHLKGGRDEQGFPYICGSIRTVFKVICQRCNSPLSLTLDIAVEVSPVRNDQEAKRIPAQYDPLLADDETISLVAMIEEEILLGIPIVPKHSLEECKVKSSEFVELEEEKDNQHPFKVLKKLLRE